jgi:RNA polymerase sigma-70 factor (ECF subfamily)
VSRSALLTPGSTLAEARPHEDARVAASRLFEAHGRFVARALARLGVRDADLQDACQEVFLTAFRRHDAFDAASRETTWLYGISLRVAANHRRKQRRSREELHAEVVPEATARVTEESLDARRLARRLDAALERLPRKKREVFVLFEFAEREMREIAKIVGAPLKTCYSRLHAAREALRDDLARSTSEVPR